MAIPGQKKEREWNDPDTRSITASHRAYFSLSWFLFNLAYAGFVMMSYGTFSQRNLIVAAILAFLISPIQKWAFDGIFSPKRQV